MEWVLGAAFLGSSPYRMLADRAAAITPAIILNKYQSAFILTITNP